MSTSFPVAIDTLTNPAATDGLAGHAQQHANANDAIEALQAKVGVTGSANPESIDYRVASVESGKVDKAAGKQLSTEDYSTVEKQKLAGIEAGANAYTHPATHSAAMVDTDSTHRFVTDTQAAAWDSKAAGSHVGSGGTAHADVVAAGASGFMTGADKTKLNGIATGANNYSHPTGDGNLHVPVTSTTNNAKFLKAGATAGSLSWSLVNKSDVGLDSVDNTSDASKPISTATQTALDLKANLISPTFTTPSLGVATGTSFNSITGLSSTTPVMDGTAAVGTGTTTARADHVHPTDTSRAPIASPSFTGPVTAPQYYNVTQPYGALQVGGVDVMRFGSDKSGTLAGFRNILINGDMRINQRGVTIAAAANGAYGPDRWKKVDASNMTQIVEAGNFIPSTIYTLSGTGVTKQQIISPASGNWTLPNIPIAATKIQLEEGSIATPFEQRPIGLEKFLCDRYFERILLEHLSALGVGMALSSTYALAALNYATKRAAPTITITNGIVPFRADSTIAGGTWFAEILGVNNARLATTDAIGLVAGNCTILFAIAAGQYIDITAEL